jgi:hypothetical protein
MRAFADWISTNRLVTILLVGYFFLSLLVFEQGRTIDNQRSLIQQLFGDSIALHLEQVHRIQQKLR